MLTYVNMCVNIIYTIYFGIGYLKHGPDVLHMRGQRKGCVHVRRGLHQGLGSVRDGLHFKIKKRLALLLISNG